MGDKPGHEFHGNQWLAGGQASESKAVERVTQAASAIRYSAETKTPYRVLNVPLPGGDNSLSHMEPKFGEHDARNAYVEGNGKPVPINLRDLVSTQNNVTLNGVLDQIKLHAAGKSEPIQVARIGGKNYVWDGHHRVTAAIALGLHTIDAQMMSYKPPSDD